MTLEPDPNTLSCCDNYHYGLLNRLYGGERLHNAALYYKSAMEGNHFNANIYLDWIESELVTSLPFPIDKVYDKAFLSNFLNQIKNSKNKLPPEKDRGLVILSELYQFYQFPLNHIGHSIRMVNDVLSLGGSYSQLKESVTRVGIIHNFLDFHGIPKPAEIRELYPNEERGWMNVKLVEFSRGKARIIGTRSDPLPPLITQSDVDIALWLAYFERGSFTMPSFSLDRAGNGKILRRLDRKTFKPDWLAETAFGQSMYFADWLMKSFTMLDGLPSIKEPYISGGGIEGWKEPSIMEVIGTTRGDYTLPNGEIANYSRLEIVVREAFLSKAFFNKYLLSPTHQYRVENIDVFIESSLYVHSGADRIHYRKDDPTTGAGAKAAIITKHYDYISDLFPVFGRVKYILGLFSLFCQAKRDGIKISESEKNRISRSIKRYKKELRSRQPSIEYSPKSFHKGGCYCDGGVSGRTDATITQTFNEPFHYEPERIFAVDATSHLADDIPTEEWIVNADLNRGGVTYYKNIKDPFTGEYIADNFSGAGGYWKVFDEKKDPSVKKQENNFTCGQTCVFMLLNNKDCNIQYNEIVESIGNSVTNIDEIVLSLNQIDQTVNWDGGTASEKNFNTISILFETGEWMAQFREPREKYGHFVIVTDMWESYLEIKDPWDGTRYKMEISEFMKVWDGGAVWRIK